jgi:hypothetical protein
MIASPPGIRMAFLRGCRFCTRRFGLAVACTARRTGFSVVAPKATSRPTGKDRLAVSLEPYHLVVAADLLANPVNAFRMLLQDFPPCWRALGAQRVFVVCGRVAFWLGSVKQKTLQAQGE